MESPRADRLDDEGLRERIRRSVIGVLRVVAELALLVRLEFGKIPLLARARHLDLVRHHHGFTVGSDVDRAILLDGGHNNLVSVAGQQYWKWIADFLDSVDSAPASSTSG